MRNGLAWSLALAAAAAVVPVGAQQPAATGETVLTCDGHRLALEPDGRFALSDADGVLIADARLTIAAPGWRGTGSQADLQRGAAVATPARDSFAVNGTITEPTSGILWRVEQRVTAGADGFRFRYSVMPAAATRVGEIVLFLHFPIARWQGRRVQLWPFSEGLLPPERPAARHFMSGPAQKAVVARGPNTSLTLAFGKPTLCTWQDAREFGHDVYHLYPRLGGAGAVRAGEKRELEFVLTPRDRSEYAARTLTLHRTGRPAIRDVAVNRDVVPRFGKFELDEAWRIDRVVELAERLGIRILCCLETQQYLRRNSWWGQFTYNAANGGPVAAPADFFVNPDADRWFRNRLRYVVARWSYSTAVYAWQFWNEVSACNDFDAANAAAWHRRMARYLKALDPLDHVVHSNFGNLDGYEEVDGLPEMEVVSTNVYSRRDMGQTGQWAARFMAGRYRKPYLLTEYGVGHRGGWVAEDPDGVIVHNGLWGPIMGGAAGTGLPWGWNHWIDVQDMYHYWRPVAETVKDIAFHEQHWEPVAVERFEFAESGRAPFHASAFFEGWPRNYAYTACPTPRPTRFRITRVKP